MAETDAALNDECANNARRSSPEQASRTPPPLIFDDGSRIIRESVEAAAISEHATPTNPRGDVSIRDYYEIDRLVDEIQKLPTLNSSDEWTHRVALQFPDHQLCDAPHVTWALEDALHEVTESTEPSPQYFVCILGDTTFAACCPDTVAAAHISATVLIHFGHACLSSIHSSAACHVLYSFGKQAIQVDQCRNSVTEAIPELVSTISTSTEAAPLRLLLLYQVQYHHEIALLQQALGSLDQIDWTVLVGRIPEAMPLVPTNDGATKKQNMPANANDTSKCADPPSGTCGDASTACVTDTTCANDTSCCRSTVPLNGQSSTAHSHVSSNSASSNPILIGGLELPLEMCGGSETNNDNWSNCIILYIGDDSSNQFLSIALRFMSAPDRPQHVWTWSPSDVRLATSLSPTLARVLNRRFYLVQRAQQCRVFGILVAHVTEPIQELVVSLRQVLDDPQYERTSYTFVVGKINPAKLANFPEIDCFVLTACPDHSLLSNERELYHVPIVTPGELLMALGVTEWGASAYSTHPSDYWSSIHTLLERHSTSKVDEGQTDSDTDSDAPYFSLVTGTYQAKPNRHEHDTALNDASNDNALVQYRSAAGDFLRGSEYRGLELATTSAVCDDDHTLAAHAALPGQSGIASNYGSR